MYDKYRSFFYSVLAFAGMAMLAQNVEAGVIKVKVTCTDGTTALLSSDNISVSALDANNKSWPSSLEAGIYVININTITGADQTVTVIVTVNSTTVNLQGILGNDSTVQSMHVGVLPPGM